MQKIPDFAGLRRGQAVDAICYEIDTAHPLYNDPLVDLRNAEFGFEDASSYYSKPHPIAGKLPGVPDAPLVRLDIAKRLVRAETFLNTDPEVLEALGAPAHIRVRDALRPHEVQKFAYEISWPQVIRSVHPDMSQEEVMAEVSKYCAKPNGQLTPTSHLTGGAVDVALVNLETGELFDRGHVSGSVNGTAYPDFYEGYHLASPPETTDQESRRIVMARRVLYYAMTNVAGLYVNPREFWHYGKGDPLSEYVSGSHRPYYGIPDLPEWYCSEIRRLQTPEPIKG